MASRRSAFVASGIILIIVAAIIVTCWLRYRPPAPIVAIIPETTAQELCESEHAGVAATIAGTPWGTYWNGPSSKDQVAQQIALVQHTESIHAAGLILAPRRSSGLGAAVRVVRSMPRRDETDAIPGGSGRLSDIRRENCHW